jgi:hypothetical protein
MSTAALPPLAPGAIPSSVRAAGPEAVEGFRAALSFERTLIEKMLGEALPGEGGEEGEGADPRVAELPETVADAIVSAGGAGIATSLVTSGTAVSSRGSAPGIGGAP